MSAPESGGTARWPAIRAGLIAIAIALSVADGVPIPRASADSMAQPANRRELERWSKILGAVGYEITPSALGERWIAFSASVASTHRTLMAPLAPFREATKTTQRWSLFPLADPAPYRMALDARCDGEWILLYRPHDAEHDFMAADLEYRRLRGVWNPGSHGPRGAFSRFFDWLGARVLSARPECDTVRVRYEQLSIALPGEEPEEMPRWHFQEVRSR